ncbi:MAG TPA: SH3 domain-containing protein [Gemmatimonadales bacterium]|nr:SH3 domain-containing protein [Gemmatimonadales bacterium]
MRPSRSLLLSTVLAATACHRPHIGSASPARPTRDSARIARQPVVVHDTALEQRAARLELKVLEQEAQVEELQTRLDDARREVVRAMAKLQSLATRAEAASGMAEAEIALQALRAANGNNSPPPEYNQGSQLLQLATTEFDHQNYAGALYLSTEAKTAAAAGQGRVGSDDLGGGSIRKGEVPFALPLRLQTTGRANVREGPGSNYKVLFTLETGVPIVAFSYVDQWLRIEDDGSRSGWIHQTLIDRRQ